ncbi:hypothetical protein FNF28_01328 [Cafeteria roenbergensis]|uniref:Uncharacterized protein n=1 Tax=Cafeteria roenbergensis TaxID=33653 RepID=A0A5A8DYM8_CAFRO|nr:hypothetical protein FNF28_01328 [Cafeteria roenbergensis]
MLAASELQETRLRAVAAADELAELALSVRGPNGGCAAVCSGASLSHLASHGAALLDTPRLAEGSNLGRFLRDSARHHARASGDGGLLCAAVSARLFVRCLDADLAWPASASVFG